MVRTFWKVVVTFGVLGLFVLIIAFIMAGLMSGFDMPTIGGGDVAIIPIHGEITLGGCPTSILFTESCADVDEIKSQLKEAESDFNVKAIVLDVYSGGGNVVASRELMRAVKKTEKPTVAWIGEIGASGAYYAASAADKVMADEDSMTGSIGVIMPVTHYYGLMDKIGVNVTVLKAGDSKDIASPYRPMTEEEKGELQGMMDKVYYSFTSDVAKNRNLSMAYVSNISQGKIYLGSEAKELGLVDELGGLDDAVKMAAELGGIKGEPGIKRPEKKVKLTDLLT
ncbi:MAG: signal peptide peptidase SppA [Candidatus Altiarchaeota archaeon]